MARWLALPNAPRLALAVDRAGNEQELLDGAQQRHLAYAMCEAYRLQSEVAFAGKDSTGAEVPLRWASANCHTSTSRQPTRRAQQHFLAIEHGLWKPYQ